MTNMQSGFNPKARWDIHIPEGSTDECPEPENLICENITALVLFKGGKAYPKKFSWKGKIYSIDNITYQWQERRGQETISYFSVQSGNNLYQLSFNNTSLGWKIDRIIS